MMPCEANSRRESGEVLLQAVSPHCNRKRFSERWQMRHVRCGARGSGVIGDSRSAERLRRWRRGVRRRVEDAGEERAVGRDPRG